jgi:hypothetical protein
VTELQQAAAAEQARRERERATERSKKAALKAMLEGQMRENAGRKVMAPMSDTEKLINTQVGGRAGWQGMVRACSGGFAGLGFLPAGFSCDSRLNLPCCFERLVLSPITNKHCCCCCTPAPLRSC